LTANVSQYFLQVFTEMCDIKHVVGHF